MASESLSQSEIDDLFGAEGGARPQRRGGGQGEVRLYDFHRPSRISKEQLRSLRALYGLLTKGMEGWFAGRVREPISLELENVEPLTFGEFTMALPSPCAAYLLSLAGSRSEVDGELAPAVIEMGRELGYFLVDRFLGGGTTSEIPDRSLTVVERAVVQIAVERLAMLLQEAWQDYVPMEPRVVGFEAIPDMLQVANPQDPVLVAHVKASFEDTSSLMLICLPFSALEKFFSGGSGQRTSTPRGSRAERRDEQQQLLDHLLRAGLEVSAHFPSFRVPLGTLSALKEGDFLATGFGPEAELEVRVANRAQFTGQGGREGDHRAVLISRRLEPDGPASRA